MKYTIRLFFCLAIVFFSCEEHEALNFENQQQAKHTTGEFFEIESIDYQLVNKDSDEYTITSKFNDKKDQDFCVREKIWAAQNIKVGALKVFKIEEGKYKIVFRLKDNWKARESHFYLGDCGSIPINNGGNPKIGNFPLKNTYPLGVNKITIIFNTSTDLFCIAAHAVVRKGCLTETAWSDGLPFNENNWATYLPFDGTDCAPLRSSEDSGGTESDGTDSGGTDSGGTDSGGTDSGGTDSGGTDSGGTDSGDSGSDGDAGAGSGGEGDGADQGDGNVDVGVPTDD